MWVLASVILESWQFQWERAKESMFFFRFCIESWLTINISIMKNFIPFSPNKIKSNSNKNKELIYHHFSHEEMSIFHKNKFQPIFSWFIYKKINKKAPFRDAPIMSNKRTLKENMIHRFRFSSTKAT